MGDTTHLLVLDFESTDTDPDTCRVLEVGAILTTFPDLDTVSTFTTLIDPVDDAALTAAKADPVVGPMHRTNGLFEALAAGSARSLLETGDALIAMLDAHGITPGEVALAGSGVGHFDLQVIRRRMPRLHTYLAYWTMDAGVLRRAHIAWGPTGKPLVDNGKPKAHRALDDAHAHLAELRAHRALLRGLDTSHAPTL